MSNFSIFGVFQMIFTQKVLNVIKAGFHRSRLIYIYQMGQYRRFWYLSYRTLLVNSNFCRLLITFANSLDPDQDRHNVGPDLNPNHLTLWWCSWKNFLKKWILKKSTDDNKSMKNYPACWVKLPCWFIQRAKNSKFWSLSPSISILCVYEQQRL